MEKNTNKNINKIIYFTEKGLLLLVAIATVFAALQEIFEILNNKRVSFSRSTTVIYLYRSTCNGWSFLQKQQNSNTSSVIYSDDSFK